MEPIAETAVPRRSAALPPPRPAKDVPNDLSFRNLSRASAGFQTHLRIVTHKDPRHLFAVPTAREPTRYHRVWVLGRALKLTREHLAVAPCTRLTQFLYHQRVNIRAEPVGSSSPDQYRRSSIPIIYVPNPFST